MGKRFIKEYVTRHVRHGRKHLLIGYTSLSEPLYQSHTGSAGRHSNTVNRCHH
jgi:hypothetical protein|tara:strand:- start:1375 stop:1533 length:159 start_codon:yes stop_codon:yes gene_type:complete